MTRFIFFVRGRSIKNRSKNKKSLSGIFLTWSLNALIVFLGIVVLYLVYALVYRQIPHSEESLPTVIDTTKQIYQVEVLNGSGAKGVAAKFTSYLRKNGYDVVDIRNYKSFNIKETFVIDRTGNLSVAKELAGKLGISEKNIIQEINPDYFVIVSIVIGKDHNQLKPLM